MYGLANRCITILPTLRYIIYSIFFPHCQLIFKNEIFISESSYEVNLSNILNSLNIYWIRPKFFWYVDKNNNKRRYYPDFYLPNFDVYIDPKNSFLIKTDIDKILLCAEQNNIRIIILGEKFLNIENVKKVVGVEGNAPSLPPCKSGTLLLS